MDRYPIINHEWSYIEGKYGGLRDYIIRVSGGCNNKIVNYDISYFSGIVEYFVRYSDHDDDRYVIDRNKDPWNRKFFMYKTEKVNISNLNVYPNPADGIVTVQANCNAAFTGTLEIIDVTGRLMTEEKINSTTLTKGIQISTENLSAGLYEVLIESDGNISSQTRLIKQ